MWQGETTRIYSLYIYIIYIYIYIYYGRGRGTKRHSSKLLVIRRRASDIELWWLIMVVTLELTCESFRTVNEKILTFRRIPGLNANSSTLEMFFMEMFERQRFANHHNTLLRCITTFMLASLARCYTLGKSQAACVPLHMSTTRAAPTQNCATPALVRITRARWVAPNNVYVFWEA